MGIETVRRHGNRLAAVVGKQVGYSLRALGNGGAVLRALEHYCRGTVLDGFGYVGPAVGSASVYGHEEAAGRNLARVVGYVGYVFVQRALNFQDAAILYNVAQFHLLSLNVGWKQGSMQ